MLIWGCASFGRWIPRLPHLRQIGSVAQPWVQGVGGVLTSSVCCFRKRPSSHPQCARWHSSSFWISFGHRKKNLVSMSHLCSGRFCVHSFFWSLFWSTKIAHFSWANHGYSWQPWAVIFILGVLDNLADRLCDWFHLQQHDFADEDIFQWSASFGRVPWSTLICRNGLSCVFSDCPQTKPWPNLWKTFSPEKGTEKTCGQVLTQVGFQLSSCSTICKCFCESVRASNVPDVSRPGCFVAKRCRCCVRLKIQAGANINIVFTLQARKQIDTVYIHTTWKCLGISKSRSLAGHKFSVVFLLFKFSKTVQARILFSCHFPFDSVSISVGLKRPEDQ